MQEGQIIEEGKECDLVSSTKVGRNINYCKVTLEYGHVYNCITIQMTRYAVVMIDDPEEEGGSKEEEETSEQEGTNETGDDVKVVNQNTETTSKIVDEP